MDKSPNQPIGIFDSGIGGLTVANAIHHFLPDERLIYFGDTVHLPYGDKSADAIRYYCLRISKFLLEQDCKMIVIACNSASSAAYDMLLDFFEGKVLFVNVVDPLVSAVISDGYKNVGVIATKATINSSIYSKKIKAINQKVKVNQLATPLLAPMIEEGFYSGNISKSVMENYLSHPDLQGIDALLLACTHYPLIKSEINSSYGGNVTILDSTDVVRDEVKRILTEENLLSNQRFGHDEFYVSDYTSHLAQIELERLGRAQRKGAPDTFDAAGYAALLRRLRQQAADETVYAPDFRREIEEPVAGALPVFAATPLVITEGNYLLLDDDPAWASVAELLDEVWYLDVPANLRLERLAARHMQFGRTRQQAILRCAVSATHPLGQTEFDVPSALAPNATPMKI